MKLWHWVFLGLAISIGHCATSHASTQTVDTDKMVHFGLSGAGTYLGAMILHDYMEVKESNALMFSAAAITTIGLVRELLQKQNGEGVHDMFYNMAGVSTGVFAALVTFQF
jgi:hypothetical protein